MVANSSIPAWKIPWTEKHVLMRAQIIKGPIISCGLVVKYMKFMSKAKE